MRGLKLSILLVIMSHLVLMGLYPLMDTTEARYADIARRMLQLNDWITPWFDDGQPFWGKPPLSFWLTLAGFNMFGLNEFGARFFYWVISMLVLAVTFACAKRHGEYTAWVAVGMLTSFFMFYLSSVSVMTDMVLLLGGVIVLCSQLNVLHRQQSKLFNTTLFAVGLSIGLLAKGPIALILFVTPMLVWMVANKNLRFFFEHYQPFLMLAITAIITLPWYVAAELKTPGFLNYFILGEHWQRFLVSGWKGDLYGSAHNFTRGTIWLFMLAATLPWCVIIPLVVFRHRNQIFAINTISSIPAFYLLAGWVLTPLVFFTFAGNILWTYVLPSLPALAIFFARVLSKTLQQRALTKIIIFALAIVVVIKGVYLLSLTINNRIEYTTTKYLVAELQAKQIPLDNVYFYQEVPFSAKFYSRGLIKPIQNLSDLMKTDKNNLYLIVEEDQPLDLSVLNAHTTTYGAYGEFIILRVRN